MNSAEKVIIPLLDAFKWQGDNSKIIEAMSYNPKNMDTHTLLETMANLNFKYYELKKIKPANLDNESLPLLVDMGTNHYVIVNIDNGDALVFDGNEEAYRQIRLTDMKGVYYGFQYAQDVDDSLIQPQSNWFNKLVYRFRGAFFQIAALTCILTLLDLLLLFFIILIFNTITTADSAKPLGLIFIGFMIYVISSYTLYSIRASVLNYTSTRMGHIVISQTYKRLMYLSPAYTETASPTAQISRIKDFDNIKKFIVSGGFISAINLLFVPIYIIAIIIVGGWIGIVPIFSLAVLIIIGLILRPFYKVRMESVSETSSQRQQSLLEILTNNDRIKSSGIKDIWINRVKKHIGQHIENGIALSKYVSITNNISFFVTSISVLIMIYGGVMQVFVGKMGTGALVGVLLLTWKTMNPIRGAFSMAVQINGLLKSINQVNRFMKLKQDNNLETNMVATKEIKGYIQFKDVSIKYNEASSPALLGINFSVKPLKTLGITGHDGAGKSTILKLIMRMYQPQAGRIIMDDMNLKQIEPLSLRRSISYAPERDLIFTGTLRESFTSYNPSISDGEIIDLSKQTGLWEYIELYGYTLDTIINARELQSMSSASKKLLNLSRMFAREAKIYLVDEMENHLDQNAIQKILDLIKKVAKENNSTVIFSTKDERILSQCDEVIRLNQGRIIKENAREKGGA